MRIFQKKPGLNLPLSSEWGEPVFSQHTILDEANEWRWRYTRKNATLIIIRAECENVSLLHNRKWMSIIVQQLKLQEKIVLFCLIIEKFRPC